METTGKRSKSERMEGIDMVRKNKDTLLSVLQDIRRILMGNSSPLVKITTKETPNRFIDNGDGTVTDSILKVTFVKDPSSIPGLDKVMDFSSAVEACARLNYAGKQDWRLPTVKELSSIIDYSCCNPAWDKNIFGGKFDDWYWTSTLCAWNTGAAWCVGSGDGDVLNVGKANRDYVRPVRSSQ